MAAPAAYSRRMFVGNAAATTVPLGLSAGAGSCTLASATNWPSGSGGDFLVVIDRGLNTEELAWCSGTSGSTLTFAARGAQGTTAVIHSAGCTIALSAGVQDLDEANQVVNQVLGQSGAAKGDILYMLSAAGPNTLQRLGVGSNGSLLSAASGVPAYTAAGTAGQSLISAGSSVPTWSTRGTSASATGGAGTSRSSGSFAALTTPCSVTLTINTSVLVLIQAQGTTSGVGNLAFAISGANTVAPGGTNFLQYTSAAAGPAFGGSFALSSLTAGTTTFALQYVGDGTNGLVITDAQITVMCLN